ncbi:hypothetical protein CTI12_AA457270 [Artemisia annua]|uniref:Helitron helicase-like domain-containing protein n=1 Tax=Artemisia annua TaxID=35608 RepID=A0A2U1LT38_ARTAN|nr:hypothetical protein CTI12_AA457270 [Artemisia annua]
MDDENTPPNRKRRSQIPTKNISKQPQNIFNSNYNSMSFNSANVNSTENVPQPMLVDSTSSNRRVSLTELLKYNVSTSNNNSRSFTSLNQNSSETVPQSMLMDSTTNNRRVSLSEILNYNPLDVDIAPLTNHKTNSTSSIIKTGSSIMASRKLPTSHQRLPLSDVTNKSLSNSRVNVFANNRRSDSLQNAQAPTIPLSGVQSKPSSFPLSNRVSSVGIAAQHISTPNTVQSKSSAITTNNRGTSNVATNSPEVTPVATLRKRQTPLSNASTVSFQTPVVCQVGQRPRKNQPSGFTTPIPSLSTQKTTYETGEPSRTNKKSKRTSFQKVSPIVFDLEDDGHSTMTMAILTSSVKNVMLFYGKQKQEQEMLIQQTKLIPYAVTRGNGSASTSSGGSNSKKPIDRTIIDEVNVLDESSDLVKTFRRARDRYKENNEQNIRIKLVAKRGKNGCQYNLPTANEVAGLVVGDLDCCAEDRDIVIEKFGDGLQRIHIFHPMYLPMQYPLLMPCAQDGYYLGIPYIKKPGK